MKNYSGHAWHIEQCNFPGLQYGPLLHSGQDVLRFLSAVIRGRCSIECTTLGMTYI